VYVAAADTGTLDSDCDFADLQVTSVLHVFQLGLYWCDPEVVSGVGVDANVWLGGLCVEESGGCGHDCRCVLKEAVCGEGRGR